MLTQNGEAAAADERERILHGGDDAPYSRSDDALSTWSGLAGVDARLEGAVHGGAARPRPGLGQRMDLGVGFPGALVRAVPQHDTLIVDHTCSDQRVWRRAAEAAPCMLESPPH